MQLLGHHPSVCGWYMPDEWCTYGSFDKRFISYINQISAEARRLSKKSKTLIAPFGTRMAKPDDTYIQQLERIVVDYIAYQDEIGVRKTKLSELSAICQGLKYAHDKAGRAKLWADIETFDFEGDVYRSALIPAKCERIKAQIEAASPYVKKTIIYTYQGMMSKSGIICNANYPKEAEELYQQYENRLSGIKGGK